MSHMQPITESNQIRQWIKQGDEFSLARAVRRLRTLLSTQSDHADYNFLLGVAYLGQGRFTDAIEYLDNACALAPRSALPWFNKSAAFCSLGDYEKGLLCGQQALPLLRDNDGIHRSRVLRNVAICQLELYRFPKAISILEEVKTGAVEILLFVCKLAVGDLGDAVNGMLKALTETEGPSGMLAADEPAGRQHPNSIRAILFPVILFVLHAFQDNHPPGLVLQSLALPPEDIKPGTPAFIEWWRQELRSERWQEKVNAKLEVLSKLSDLEHAEGKAKTTYTEWSQSLVRDPEIKGGATVFPNSRLSIRRVGGSLMRGEKPEYLLEDYPYLTKQDLLFSIDYVCRETEEMERLAGSWAM